MIFEADFNIEEIVYHKVDGQKGIITEILFRPKGSVFYSVQWAHNVTSYVYNFEITRDQVFENN